MRYMAEFRDAAAARALAEKIRRLMPDAKIAFMEICGGHTLTALKYGLRRLLPEGLALKSGPGCPVCVTPQEYIDGAVELARRPGFTVASFGDMLRVPGTAGSLLLARSEGRDVRVCLSALEAVDFAASHPEREVVFLGIGFETTAPTVAAAILEAAEKGLANFSVLTALKTMPAAMRALLEGRSTGINGFICPGHVTAVTGSRIYEPIAAAYGMPCVVSGFEPTDMLRSIMMLLRQVRESRSVVENEYTRVAGRDGNPAALAVIEEVFEPADAVWRGLGMIPGSGLTLRPRYGRFDARTRFTLDIPPSDEQPGCRCGDVMRGVVEPADCPHFASVCRPDHPLGACMVSAEGACGIYYAYRR